MEQVTEPDGTAYYEYIFIYNDDILVVSYKLKPILTVLDYHYLLKPESIVIPKTY